MAKYNPTVTTDKGEALIAKLMAGDIGDLDFTRIGLSDKDYTNNDLAKLTSLEQIKQETLVSEKTRIDENNINVHGIIYNTDLLEGYNLKTIGLYASDPDEGEILYSVTTAIKADYITEADEHNIGSVILDLMTKVSKAPVNMQGNPSALVDVFMLNKKLDRGEGLEENFNTAVKIVTELKKKQNETDNRLLTTVKTIWGAINELFNNKLEKGGYVGNAKNLNDEISKIASTTQFGRFKVGTNLRIDENGFLHGNPAVDISGKLDKGNVAEKYNTAEKIGIELDKKQNSSDSGLKTNAKTVVGAINENYEKFKNFCPYSVGDIYITTLSTNPATRYLGTTWEKIEGRFLLATSGSNASGQTGGSNTKTISKANLPNVKLQVDSFSVTTKKHTHGYRNFQYMSGINIGNGGNGTNWVTSQTGEAGGDNTGTASPYTSTLGSGTPLDITPAYYTVHIWKRLT